MNAVLTLAHNNLLLTERCLASVQAQSLPAVSVFVVDNDSTDGTRQRLTDLHIPHARFSPQLGVSAGWNYGLREFFAAGARHVLVVNNDVRLPPNFYLNLLTRAMRADVHFLTGTTSDDPACLDATVDPQWPLVPHPDFSAFLITRQAWDRIGPFDESMRLYSSDQDYHLRGWRLGVPMLKANVPFYHERSSTLAKATPEERRELELQADADRATLSAKWGVSAGGPDYAAQFTEAYWGIYQDAQTMTGGNGH